jgi:4-amino-4-deoxy-L-arabinose transferase-like glycosyltransferase
MQEYNIHVGYHNPGGTVTLMKDNEILSNPMRVGYLAGGIFILSLVIRLIANSYISDALHAPLSGDEPTYVNIAMNLLSGSGYSMNGLDPTAFRAPGYPLFLVVVLFLTGKSLLLARIVNILIGSATVVLVLLFGEKMFDRTTALVASLLLSVYPVFVGISGELISDSLFVFLISAFFLMVALAGDNARPSWKMLGAGLFLGWALVTRTELIVFFPFLIVWSYFHFRKTGVVGRALIFLLLPAMCFAIPWVYRNYQIYEKFTMTTGGGAVAWGVHNPSTFGDWTLMGGWYPPKDSLLSNAGERPPALRNPAGRYLPEREWDKQLLARAIESIKSNIRLMPKMEIYKLRLLFASPGAVESLVRFPLFFFFFFGMTVSLIHRDRRHSILYVFLLFPLIVTLVLYTDPRLRMAADVVFLLVGSFGLLNYVRWIRSKPANPG